MTQEEFKSIKEIEKGCGICGIYKSIKYPEKTDVEGLFVCCGQIVYWNDNEEDDELILCPTCQAKKQNTLAISKMIDELGELWEVAFECGEKTGEFEYIQFKEHPLFDRIKKELMGE